VIEINHLNVFLEEFDQKKRLSGNFLPLLRASWHDRQFWRAALGFSGFWL